MSSPSSLDGMVEQTFAAAFAHHAAARLDEAEDHYRLLLELDEQHAPALHYLGVLLHQRGQHAPGLALMHQAADLAAPDADWRNDLGNVLFACQQFAEAVHAYDSALQLRPGDAQLWNNLGAALRAQGQHADAIAACERALAIDAQLAAAMHQLAELHGQAGERMLSSRYQCMAYVLPPHEGKSRELLAISYYFLGQPQQAAEVCRQWLREEPGHPIATHMHAAYAGLPSDTVPRDYIVRRFDDYADHFDTNLVAHLDYRGPQVLAALLQAHLPAPDSTLDVLDAGCGTGLCAPVLAPYARRLEGIDLSPNMLRHAARHHDYAQLAQAEVSEWMAARTRYYDLIVACDVLIYCGQLENFFAAAAQSLRDGGHLFFTVEQAASNAPAPYHLHPSGRFRHQRAYLEHCLRSAGLHVRAIHEESLRMEMQQPVPGLVVLAGS